MLLGTVGRLAVRDDVEGGHHLPEWVRLQTTRSFHPLMKEWLVLDGVVDASKDATRHAKALLRITFVVDRRLRVDIKVVSLEIQQPSDLFAPLVRWTPKY